MLNPMVIDSLLSSVYRRNHPNSVNALTAIGSAAKVIWGCCPCDRSTRASFVINKWFEYIGELTEDMCQDDLGSVYRQVAEIYHSQADNIRDESHHTEVER